MGFAVPSPIARRKALSFLRSGELLPEKWRVAGASLRAQAGAQSITFRQLPPGRYAIIVFHDENDNGLLDENALGVPVEGYGFSNNAKGFLSAPSFNAAAITLPLSDQTIDASISLIYPREPSSEDKEDFERFMGSSQAPNYPRGNDLGRPLSVWDSPSPQVFSEIVIVAKPRSCLSGPMKALRILVIEDDALIASLFSELLAGMGHDVCAMAATEAHAVAAAARHRPDLIIVDVALARGNGVSAVEEILRAGPVAHLFVSGDPGTVQTHRPSAVAVRKPFREADLVKAIESALNAAAC